MRKKTTIFSLMVIFSVFFYSIYIWKTSSTDQNWQRQGTLANINLVHDYLCVHLMDYENDTLGDNALLRILMEKCRKDMGKLRWLSFKKNGALVDLWGNPVRIEIIDRGAKTDKPRVKVWSIGKNGVDEQGRGDDIVSAE